MLHLSIVLAFTLSQTARPPMDKDTVLRNASSNGWTVYEIETRSTPPIDGFDLRQGIALSRKKGVLLPGEAKKVLKALQSMFAQAQVKPGAFHPNLLLRFRSTAGLHDVLIEERNRLFAMSKANSTYLGTPYQPGANSIAWRQLISATH